MELIEAYIDEVLSGRSEAFEKIVEEYQSMVFTICVNMLKERALAEEAAQDVFVKVYKNLKSFARKSSFKTWIYRIAYRTAIDYHRKKRYHNVSIDQQDQPMQLADDHSNAQELLERQDEMKTLESAMKQLDNDDNLLLSLYYFQEKNIQEVAKITGLTESNVKIKLFRIRKKLRSLLQNSTLSSHG